MKIAIIGAGGRMGSWFTNYFTKRGFDVSVFDVNKKLLKSSHGVRIAYNIDSCVKDADIVLITVPVRITPNVIKDCAKRMKAGAVISEISSVKSKSYQALKTIDKSLQPLCIHPMFGPGATEKLQLKIILLPVRNEQAELKILHAMFANAMVKVLSNVGVHDKSIATVLGLTYFVNIAFAKIMSTEDTKVLKQVSGTTYGLQSLLAESVLASDPDLVSALIQDNPYAKRYIQKYLHEAAALARLASATNDKKLKNGLKKIKNRLKESQDLERSYRQMYNIIENLR